MRFQKYPEFPKILDLVNDPEEDLSSLSAKYSVCPDTFYAPVEISGVDLRASDARKLFNVSRYGDSFAIDHMTLLPPEVSPGVEFQFSPHGWSPKYFSRSPLIDEMNYSYHEGFKLYKPIVRLSSLMRDYDNNYSWLFDLIFESYISNKGSLFSQSFFENIAPNFDSIVDENTIRKLLYSSLLVNRCLIDHLNSSPRVPSKKPRIRNKDVWMCLTSIIISMYYLDGSNKSNYLSMYNNEFDMLLNFVFLGKTRYNRSGIVIRVDYEDLIEIFKSMNEKFELNYIYFLRLVKGVDRYGQ